MSKTSTEQMDALMGGANTPAGAAEAAVSKDEFERTKHELDNSRGRLKALDARLKELEKENAELRASQSRDELISSALSEEERAKLDPEFLNAMVKLNAASEERLRKANEEADRRRAEEEAASLQERKEEFCRKVEEQFPGFFASVGAGGPNAAAWGEFCQMHGPSINAAYAQFNLKTITQFIKMFQSKLGIRVPSGSQGGATTPDPRNLGSGATVQHGGPNKVYSAEEFAALEKQAMQLRRRGDWDGYRSLNDEINNILAEGRVKD